jgi:hypothetical protein
MLDAVREEYLKHGTVSKIAHRTDVSGAPAKKKPRRNLAKRSIGAGLAKR